MTLLMFIWTVSCFKLMANTTRVSHGAPCWPAAFPFLLKDGVDVFVTESTQWCTKIREQSAELLWRASCSQHRYILYPSTHVLYRLNITNVRPIKCARWDLVHWESSSITACSFLQNCSTLLLHTWHRLCTVIKRFTLKLILADTSLSKTRTV